MQIMGVIGAGLLLGSPAASAQTLYGKRSPDARRPSAHFGITTGLATTWLVDHKLLQDPNYVNVQTYRRAPIGFTAGYHFNDRNGIQLELNRTLQGADFQIISPEDGEPRIGTKNIRLAYWSLPVLYKYTAGAARQTRFEFHIGPQINFLQSADDLNRYDRAGTLRVVPGKTDLTTLPNNMVASDTQQRLATTSDYRTRTLSAAFGLGIEVKVAGPVYASALVRSTITINDIRSQKGQARARARNYYAGRQSALLGVQVGVHWQFIRPSEGHPKDRRY